MHRYKAKAAPLPKSSTTPAVQTQQQEAYNILFRSQMKKPADRTVEQEWNAYKAEPTDIPITPLTYWQVSHYIFNTFFALFPLDINIFSGILGLTVQISNHLCHSNGYPAYSSLICPL